MEKAKIRPTPKPFYRSASKSACVITSWTAPDMQNFASIVGSEVSVPQIRDFAKPLWWLVFLFVLGGSSIRLQSTPLNGYLRKIRKTTSFRVRKCLLAVSLIDCIVIFRLLNFRKAAILGTNFDWTVFFVAENHFKTWDAPCAVKTWPIIV